MNKSTPRCTEENLAKAIDCIHIALAIETLAYHDKGYLDRTLSSSNAKISETVQGLLRDAEELLTTEVRSHAET